MIGRLRRVSLGTVVLLTLYVVAVVAALWLLHGQRVHECETAAELRNDHRSMWTALLDANPDAPQHDTVAALLDEHLPQLECHGETLVRAEETP